MTSTPGKASNGYLRELYGRARPARWRQRGGRGDVVGDGRTRQHTDVDVGPCAK